MLSVQNNETWALSQANPKTEPILPKPSHFFTKTEPLCPKDGACFSQKRILFFPKTELHNPGGGWFSQSLWQIFLKSVADFSQSLWRISPKSVADFPKIGDGFPQNRWQISAIRRISCPSGWLIFSKMDGRFSRLVAGLHEAWMCGLICAMLVAFLLRAGFCNPFLMCDRTAQTSFGCIYVFYKI